MMQEEQVKLWGDKPYYSLDHYFKKTFGTKVYKIALNAGMTCPVRDGTLGSRGCIFCSKGGSGDFASAAAVNGKPDIKAQLEEGKKLVSSKNPVKYLAYFQAYTNTYAPADELRSLYKAALDDRDVIGISIATRPDCLPDEVLKLLDELKREYPQKVIWIELGLQTIHRETVKYIRRGYETSVFELAVHRLNDMGIPVAVMPADNPDNIIKDKVTGQSKGFGFVEMSDEKFLFFLMNFEKHECIKMTNMFDILEPHFQIITGVGENGGYHAQILISSLLSEDNMNEN